MFRKPFPGLYLALIVVMIASLTVGVIAGAFAGGFAGYALAGRQIKAVGNPETLVSVRQESPVLLAEEGSQTSSPERTKLVVELVPEAKSPQSEAPTQVTTSTDEEDLLLQSIYKRVNPSVVNIQVTGKMELFGMEMPNFHQFPNLPDDLPDIPGLREKFGDLFGQRQDDEKGDDLGEELKKQLPQEFFNRGEGSGFVYDKEGYIVTNNHVVEGADTIRVTFYDDVSVPAEVVGTDPDSDLAVIKVDPKGLDLAPISLGDSNALKVGQRVIAIGNPFGLSNTMTAGIVSALGRSIPAGAGLMNITRFNIPDVIQTDAAINPGNSGGPLLNASGEVVGVNTAIESPIRAWSGIGFAVPSAIMKKVVPVLIEGKDMGHAWLGISGTTLNPQLNEAIDLALRQRGVLVVEVTEDSPAGKAGLKSSEEKAAIDGIPVNIGGDVIIGIDDAPVREFDDLLLYLTYDTEVGQEVTLTLLRGGEKKEIVVKLTDRPDVSEWNMLFGGDESGDTNK